MTTIHIRGDGKDIEIPYNSGKFFEFVSAEGFVEFSKKNTSDKKNLAVHMDRGAIEKVESSQIFVLIEESGMGGGYLYKTVASKEEGEAVAEKIINSEYCPVGSQVYVSQDLVCYRKVFADQVISSSGSNNERG